MKKLLIGLMIGMFLCLSGCVWCDDCGHGGHHHSEYGRHGGHHGNPRGVPHHGGSHR